MNKIGISTSTDNVNAVFGRYGSILKLQAEQEIEAAAATKMAAEAAAEASDQASLTLEPIREGAGDVMPAAREVYKDTLK